MSRLGEHLVLHPLTRAIEETRSQQRAPQLSDFVERVCTLLRATMQAIANIDIGATAR